MTISDLMNNFQLQGYVAIKRWDEDKNDYDLLYSSDIEYDKPESKLMEEYEIKYMYPILFRENLFNSNVAAMVIEVE